MNKRDYSSNYKIKEFMINEIAPKMFDIDEVNQFNVGLLGYVTEIGSTTTEDAFNAMNIYLKETFPARATMADTIYTNASYFAIENIMGTPSRVQAYLFIKEEDIINKGEKQEERFVLTFDSGMEVRIGGTPYAFDYDVIISARPYRGDYQFLAQYDMSIINAVSDVKHPYLRTHKLTIEGVKYIGVSVELGQYKRIIVDENVLNDTSLSAPVIQIEYTDQVADIDVLYKEPNSNTYIRLEKRMEGTVPSEKPFFFYSFRNNNIMEVTFTTRDRYFQPVFNSDLKVILYETQGSAGNFKEYNGTDIQTILENPKFDYMTQIIPFIAPDGASVGGKDALDLEEIRRLTVERFSASGAYNTEDDITLFMRNYTDINNMNITFIRKRDDLVERVFTGFILMKDKFNDYYHTNTLNTRLEISDFNHHSETLSRHILKPGRLFKYEGNSKDKVEIYDSVVNPMNYTEHGIDEQFLYTNPFLITFQENPNNISYYINTVNENVPVDFIYADESSHMQFIVNSLQVVRNAIADENKYTFTVKMKPTSAVGVDPENGKLTTDGLLKVAISFEEKDGTEAKGIILEQKHYDETTNVFTFEGCLETDDMISSDSRILVNNVHNLDNLIFGEHMIRMHDIVANVNVFYDLGRKNNNHSFKNIEDLGLFTLVNKYSTDTNRLDLVVPFNFIRSRMTLGSYVRPVEEGSEETERVKYMDIYQIPMIAAHHVDDVESLLDFIKEVKYIYYTLKEITEEKTSNYNIDIKFYNTYGRSKNFTIGEEVELLDRTNINLHIQVKPTVGSLVDELFEDIKEYTKNYIENINDNISENIGVRGYNAIYISNLIQELENTFSNLSYMKFKAINEYDSSVQVIENATVDTESMSLAERRDYIPEFLTIRLEDIQVDLLSR